MRETLEAPAVAVVPPPAEIDYAQIELITPADKTLFVRLGFEWPAPEQEAETLEDLNRLMLLGSQNLTEGFPEDEAHIVVTAREEFLSRFPRIRQKAIATLKLIAAPLVPSFTSLDALRALHTRGISTSRAVNQHPAILTQSGTAIHKKMDYFDDIGLSSQRMVHADTRVLSRSNEGVTALLSDLYAAAPIFGWTAAETRAHVTEQPRLLGSTGDNNLLAAIASALFGETQQRVSPSDLLTLHINSKPAVIAAYLQNRDTIHSFTDLRRAANNYTMSWDDGALQYILLQNADDPIVATYLAAHPIKEDHSTLKDAYERQLRGPVSWGPKYDTEWQGHAFPGGTTTTYEGFTIRSGPPPTESELTVLKERIRVGEVARRRLQEEGQSLDIEERMRLVREVRAEYRARITLIARHVGVIVPKLLGIKPLTDEDGNLSFTVGPDTEADIAVEMIIVEPGDSQVDATKVEEELGELEEVRKKIRRDGRDEAYVKNPSLVRPDDLADANLALVAAAHEYNSHTEQSFAEFVLETARIKLSRQNKKQMRLGLRRTNAIRRQGNNHRRDEIERLLYDPFEPDTFGRPTNQVPAMQFYYLDRQLPDDVTPYNTKEFKE
jgi:hypothetical protein